jgi:signal transduction histidine kinase
LCTNAIKYRKPDIPLRLKVSSYQEEDYTLITFEDNGLGIDLDRYADRIFGLYQRFHENLAEGKGIGLYLVNNQLKALGGKLEVESKVGKGSIFKVYLKNQSSNGEKFGSLTMTIYTSLFAEKCLSDSEYPMPIF